MSVTTVSEPVVLDSSGWLEYLTDDAKAEDFAPYLEGSLPVFIPTVVLYEVRKVLLVREGRTLADVFLSDALRRTIVPFDEVLAINAADLSILHKLSMADAIIYATAKHCGAHGNETRAAEQFAEDVAFGQPRKFVRLVVVALAPIGIEEYRPPINYADVGLSKGHLLF